MRHVIKFIKSKHFVCFVLMAVMSLFVILARERGFTDKVELLIYDRYLRYSLSGTKADDRVVVVEATEGDIQKLQMWPMNDATMAQMFKNILKQEPCVVGLDIFRDIPVPPGGEELLRVFQEHNNIIAIKKLGDASNPPIAAPYVLKDPERAGFNDMPVDTDGIIRRGLLFLDDGETFSTSFAMRLAAIYLKSKSILPGADNATGFMKLGKAVFVPLKQGDGGYKVSDMGGYLFLIDFKGGPFKMFTLTDVLSDKIPPHALKDKVVIVGVTAGSMKDFVYTPLGGSNMGEGTPGMHLHAHVTSELIRYAGGENSPLKFPTETAVRVWIIVWGIIGGMLGFVFRTFSRLIAALLVSLSVIVAVTFLGFASGWWIPGGVPIMSFIFSGAVITTYMSKKEKAERNMLMNLFGKHVSKTVAQSLWENRDEFIKDGRPCPKKLIATVLFTDLKGFTSVSEKFDAAGLMDWLNEYMDAMAGMVLNNGGVVNKYIGDAVMAIFGVPVERTTDAEISEDAVNAVHCALGMEQELVKLNEKWEKQGLPKTSMRVGIFTGPLIAGCLGSSERLEYTVIGDTVNTASRLESFDKDLPDGEFAGRPCRILIGQSTYKYTGDKFYAKQVGEASLKGKTEKIVVYRIGGLA
ncbi:CHASE2 domain-containing protein [Candidatus Magnetomonas plexicatena]|uniref:CHASE2 domain-containing protein n=1 Tax=Candidatus Magnetomonas plexicatena TaxID=2552947 RepID=UPI001C75D89E|nr:adenylate/guanylate cyclase domain-containing protein [Nitrospirales bacterium LBB_01]